jgi:hypothetical protein
MNLLKNPQDLSKQAQIVTLATDWILKIRGRGAVSKMFGAEEGLEVWLTCLATPSSWVKFPLLEQNCGSSNKATALHLERPKFKPQSHQKKNSYYCERNKGFQYRQYLVFERLCRPWDTCFQVP